MIYMERHIYHNEDITSLLSKRVLLLLYCMERVFVDQTWPLSSGAKQKCRDRVLIEGEKIAFLALPGKGGHSRLMPKDYALLWGRIVRGLQSKRRKTRVKIRIRVGAKMHSSFYLFLGIFVTKASVRRSQHDSHGGLLGQHILTFPRITILAGSACRSEIGRNKESSWKISGAYNF